MPRTSILLFLFLCLSALSAQMNTAQGPRFGNEWIEEGKSYLAVEVAQDGIYRLDAATLSAAGMNLTADADRFQLHHFGEPIALRVTDEGLYFFGEKARGELDAFLFPDADAQQLNPRYGMHTDTAVYYLSLGAVGAGQRFDANSEPAAAGTINQIQRQAEQVSGDKFTKFFRRVSGNTIYFSHYELAEGFGARTNGDLLSSNGTTESVAEVALPHATGGTAKLDLRFSLAFDAHRQVISVNNQELGVVEGDNWMLASPSYTFTPGGTTATVRLVGQAGDRDKANLAYASITYPAQPVIDQDQLPFSLPAGAGGELSFSGGSGGSDWVLYGLTDGKLYFPETGTTTFSLPAAASTRRFQLALTPLSPASVRTTTLTDVLPAADVDYLLLTSRRLQGAGVDALVEHRRSATGGNYRVHVAYVEDIYEQFGYGLRRHPRAVKNYLEAAMDRAPQLAYLFIVGKGREYNDLRTPSELENASETFFVPSYGLPASDNLLSAPTGGVIPRLATGRLSAITTDEVAIYANKLKDVERQIELAAQTIEDLDWMKQVLHLGGGQTPGEQSSIKRNLATMEETIRNSRMGANVTSLFRTSSEPIETTRQEQIFGRINAGTAIITFFGHSSSQGFDFNIDNPENYENKNKYPLMMSLGCYSGDAFTQARSISERFIFLPDGGAVTFAASKGVGYIGALGNFGERVYHYVGNEEYGNGIGDAIQATVKEFSETSDFTLGILLEQFSLSGDPAFRFHPRPGPDLVIDPASVSFSPSVVPAQDATFEVNLRLLNLGQKPESVPDSMQLLFRQQLPDGELREIARRRVAVPHYDQLTTLSLPNVGLEAVGQNRILITVDIDDEISEQPAPAEANNELIVGGQAGVPLTVIANTAKTAFPPRYATVGPGVELVAGSTDPLAPERRYRLQMSTEADFTPALVDEEILSPGGVIRYAPAVSLSDSTTYYWRISPDSTSTEDAGFIWSESSFTYRADQPRQEVGWAQQHPGQLVNGEAENIKVQATDPTWNFSRNTNDVRIVNGVYQSRDLPQLAWNGTRFNSPHPWRTRAGIQVMVVDSINNRNWYRSGDGSYNSIPGEATPWSFDTRTEEGREGLIRFLDEGIAPGRYVFVYSAQRGSDIEYHNEGWLQDSARVGRTIYGMLEDEGAQQVRLLQELGSVPYTFAYLKGVGPIAEAIAASQDATTTVLIPIQENWQRGSYTSERIGPALEWSDMNIKFRDEHIESSDSCYFRLYGETTDGRRDLLTSRSLDIRNRRSFDFSLAEYSAVEYPYLLTTFELFDEELRTVASVDHVYVDYRRPGDVAVSPTVAYSAPDSLEQGQTVNLEVGYENIARADMDSLLVELLVIDKNNQVTTLRKRQPPLAAGATGKVTFALPTQDLNSRLRLQMALNPDKDQPENVLFNNTLFTDVGIEIDRVAPDMQVYFDGRRIRNGELVSARPEILIQLRDNSNFRRLDDSSAYSIQLIAPDGSRETIPLSDSRIDFIPADGGAENKAEVYFRPELLQDGTYVLVVNARDRSGNNAGRLEFRQEFEVINQQLVSNVLAYPNPFTTQTRFVYTLTGNVAPETFRIQIMTVSGRVVRDIDILAAEDVKIGTHQTDFTWDGTDEYGDPLANGVYLYRVITSDGDGNTLEKYDTGTDQYFLNDMGKVVILR